MASERSSRHRSATSSTRSNQRPSVAQQHSEEIVSGAAFVPCTATASHVLYAYGKDVISLHHDTLALDRRFEKHRSPVTLLAIDNVSERGSGRMVASYDVDQVAIIWDLFSGNEVARFSSYQQMKVASWMKNGNISFGNNQGHVIVFEPASSEHKSVRTIFDPITSIAPAADCKTYAIGYNNGSVLIANIAPSFTILHSISTDVSPTAIVGLAWHASSSKSKTDMLAIQHAGGDLRVWNVAKPGFPDAPKPIRTLERGVNGDIGLHWISWSKNGRIIQYSKGEILAWDVRTKQVAYVPVPVRETVRGLSNYGPSAVLFTISPEFSVQQYDLTPPTQEDLPAMFTLTKSVRFDEAAIQSSSSTPKMNARAILGAAPPMPVFRSLDPHKGPSTFSTIQRATDPAEHARLLRTGMASPLSSRDEIRSVDSRSSTGRRHRAPSMASYAASGTDFSTISRSYVGREAAASPFWPQTASVASSSRASKSSRLRKEVPHTPEDNLVDLFPYTRARLAAMPYQPGNSTLNVNTAPTKDLRLQMLRIVFGWDQDIEELIRDEIVRHNPGSLNATLLQKWLGEVPTNYMAMASNDAVTGTDWMLLALSQMGSQSDQAKIMGRGFAQKLLQQGDIHTAATILFGLKDFDEAADIYVSRNYFMEGILLTTLAYPEDWQRQSNLVRRWGDYVVENSQQHLAIRCFTVTGADTSIPWATPTQSPFEGATNTRMAQTQQLSPPTSPDRDGKLSRMTPKTSSLKLITTFGNQQNSTFRHPGTITDDRTPTNAVGITPIAQSAMSPVERTNFLRPGYLPKTPKSERRHRLSSIGETSDAHQQETKDQSTSEMEADSDEKEDLLKPLVHSHPKLNIDTTNSQEKVIEPAPLTLSSARYDPKEEEATPKPTPQTAIPNSAARTKMFSHSETNSMASTRGTSRARNGSRDRKPMNLSIQMPSLDQVNLNAIATGADGRTPIRRRTSLSSSSKSGSNAGRLDILSPPTTGQSWGSSAKSPSISGRSTDQYISSLDSARVNKEKVKSSRTRERSKARNRLPSEDRGRSGTRYIKPAKRSPSSPKPMSPEDLHRYRSLNTPSVDSVMSRDSSPEDDTRTQRVKRKGRSTSKFSDASHMSTMTARKMSPEPALPGRAPQSRPRSPIRLLSPIEARGRNPFKTGGSVERSPSSPLPMSDQAKLYQTTADDYVEDPLKLVEANRQRLRSRQRSSSRKPGERGVSSKREPSTNRLRLQEGYQGLHDPYINQPLSDQKRLSDPERNSDTISESGLKRIKSHRTLKKEIAARELEARRESFLARTSTTIPQPPPSRPSPPTRAATDSSMLAKTITLTPEIYQEPPTYYDPIDRSASTGPYGTQTPRAMRHPRHSSRDDTRIPSVPEVPIQWSPTGHPIGDLPRSMSVPVGPGSQHSFPSIHPSSPIEQLNPNPAIPNDMPVHPAFLRQVRPSTRKNSLTSSFAPLGEIGRHRRTPSLTTPPIPPPQPHLASIGETLSQSVGTDAPVIDVPVYEVTSHGVIPALQHLATPPPPPPPPAGPDPNAQRLSFSTSSGLGIGSIAIVMDDESPSSTPIIDVGSLPPQASHPAALFPGMRPGYLEQAQLRTTSPPLPPLPHSGNSLTLSNSNPYTTAVSPPPSEAQSSRSHHRGRGSVSERLNRMTERMRSNSRPRERGTSKARSPMPNGGNGVGEKPLPMPYETKVGGEGRAYF